MNPGRSFDSQDESKVQAEQGRSIHACLQILHIAEASRPTSSLLRCHHVRAAIHAAKTLALKNSFCKPLQRRGSCPAFVQTKFCFFFSENMFVSTHPASSKRGVRVVTTREAGMRWT